MGALTASFLTGTGRFQYARTGENGEEILYFHDYEEAHMQDVRNLIRLDTVVMKISFAAAVLMTAAGILLRDPEKFCRGILTGLRIMLGVLLLLLGWALIAFDGNSPAMNLLQEAKNQRGKCRIFVNIMKYYQ